MGDPFRKQQVKNAKKRREEAHREACTPRLPTRAVLKDAKLALMPSNGTEYVCGEKLAVMADEASIKVVRDGYVQIGHIEGEFADELRQAFAASGGDNVLQVLVTEVADISGVAYAQVLEP